MNWWLWMLAGAAIAMLALMLIGYFANRLDDRSMSRQQAVRDRHHAAEQQMQRIVQKTITEMFNATRGYR